MPLGNQITEKIKSPENIAQNLSSEIEYEISDPKYSLDDIIVSNSTLEDISLVISLKQDFDRVFKDMGFQETHKYSKKFILYKFLFFVDSQNRRCHFRLRLKRCRSYVKKQCCGCDTLR